MDSFDFVKFLDRHAGSSPHVVAARLAHDSGARADTGAPVPAPVLLEIYQRRANHLSNIATAHAETLCHEVRTLCIELEAVPDSLVSMVGISATDGHRFVFFEDQTSSRLLGSTMSYDARLISDDDHIRIWGKPRF